MEVASGCGLTRKIQVLKAKSLVNKRNAKDARSGAFNQFRKKKIAQVACQTPLGGQGDTQEDDQSKVTKTEGEAT